jgi:uncharacterized protein YbaP (TraB family)
MLWEITNTPHKLLGSMHHIPANFSMPGWFHASYKGIDRFVFESDVRSGEFNSFGFDLTRAHLKWPGAPEMYQRANRLLAGIGVSEPLEDLRPWRAANSLQHYFVTKYGYSADHGVAHQLRLLADEMGSQADFFETNARSSELRDNSCKKFRNGLAYFKRAIDETKSGAAQSNQERVFKAWLSSDVAELRAVRKKENSESSYMVNVDLQRNREWVPMAKRLISEKKPTLFVMGAFHTVGKGSFIEHMEGAGFKFNFISQ